MKTAIIGGGAAGFFLAINLKEMVPQMEVTIFERSQRVLAKVEISGGGRCNCTNSFAHVKDMAAVYPRGHRLLGRLMKGFGPRDAYEWFERHGVELVTQEDDCVFPATQDAHTIINCFMREARHHGVNIKTGVRIETLDELGDYDFVAVTTGGSPRMAGLEWLRQAGHEVVEPVPSLFTLSIDEDGLHELMGTVVNPAIAFLPGTSFRAEGPLLITHWGVSGPAILRLSSYAARHLSECRYKASLAINWTGKNENEVREVLEEMGQTAGRKQLGTVRPFALPQRLWGYLLTRTLGQRAQSPWNALQRKEINRLSNALCNDTYLISGRAPFRDEFVTCGGIALSSVYPATLESKVHPRLYFAGEVLDIDGVTGGFNFQAAWTTAYTVAQDVARKLS